MLEAPDPLLGDRPLDPRGTREPPCATSRLTLPPERRTALLTTVPAAFHAGVNDVLLTALALAVADWRRRRDGDEDTAVLRGPGGPRPGGVRRGRRPLPYGRLVHQHLPGAAGPGAGRLGRRPGPAAPPPATHSSGSRSSCAGCRTTASATGCCATSTRETATARGRAAPPQIGFNYLGRFDHRRAGRGARLVAAPEDVPGGSTTRTPMRCTRWS